MSHRNAKLTIHGRRLIIERLEAGWTQSQAADAGGVSRATIAKWAKRFCEEGMAGLADRSSRPHHSPRMVSAPVAAEVCRLRRELAAGPHRIAWEMGIAASTVYVVLKRSGLNLLAALDRTTREVIRYERDQPGELVHLDVKRLGRVPDGGGKRFAQGFSENGAGYSPPGQRGHDFLHVAIDDHSRFAYVESLPDERGETTAGFLKRMTNAFTAQGLEVQRLLTDNGGNYRSRVFANAASDLGIDLRRTRAYRPQTNGKAEAFIKTLQREWAYQRPYSSNQDRFDSLQPFVHRYNHHRPHTAIGNNPPAARLGVNNLCGNNI
jgi:transposase InsO family protein